MPVYIEMPKLSDTMTEGTLVKWHVKVGDTVEIGNIIADVETDKATMEMEAFEEGTIHQILIAEGSKVGIGEKLAMVLEEGEEPPKEGEKPAAAKETSKADAKEEPAKAEVKTAGSPAPETKSQTEVAPSATQTSSPGRVKSSPLARKIASAKNIDLAGLKGSGPGGRIVAADVESANSKPASSPTSPAPAPAQIKPDAAAGTSEVIALSGMRRVIADRLLASKTQIPHFYLHIEVDAGPISRLRRQLNQISDNGGQGKITINDFILLATARATAAHPKVNASFAGDSVVQYADVNLAVAVAVDDGLVTPVLRAAHNLTLKQISDGVKDLATRARSKKLKPDEYAGGTITVSNLGAYGIERFAAIINPPQSAILAVGAIIKKPVVNEKDEIVVGERMSISLSCDHRVIDGAVGAEFLSTLRRLVENPALMLF
jgi:pyruvate dehydrogenase E2 component (dihydrolipoamide acetyltransferase)